VYECVHACTRVFGCVGAWGARVRAWWARGLAQRSATPRSQLLFWLAGCWQAGHTAWVGCVRPLLQLRTRVWPHLRDLLVDLRRVLALAVGILHGGQLQHAHPKAVHIDLRMGVGVTQECAQLVCKLGTTELGRRLECSAAGGCCCCCCCCCSLLLLPLVLVIQSAHQQIQLLPPSRCTSPRTARAP